MTERELLFSLTKRDFEVTTFKSGGPGGQHRNKVSTGVRIKHPPSGAVAEASDSKSQAQNKQTAFLRLVCLPAFRVWLQARTYEAMGRPSITEIVDKAMSPKNLRVEGKVADRWERLDD